MVQIPSPAGINFFNCSGLLLDAASSKAVYGALLQPGAGARGDPTHSTASEAPAVRFILAGLASLVIALSRPTTTVVLPAGKATIMLALDVLRSMCSTDIPPNRLKAAKAAILSFIDRQDLNTQIGIVAFADTKMVLAGWTGRGEESGVVRLKTAKPFKRPKNVFEGCPITSGVCWRSDCAGRTRTYVCPLWPT